MLLRTALECHKRIGEYRNDLYKLGKLKGISDTNIIDLNQQLDKEITLLQKIMQEVRSIQNLGNNGH
jgi:hypothetical protein